MDVSLNQASQLSLFNASDQGDLEMGLSQAPLDRLARYLEYVCRMIADQVLQEAEKCKHEFLDMPMGSIDNLDKPNRSSKKELNKNQLKAWEDWWMEQLRQQVHIEI